MIAFALAAQLALASPHVVDGDTLKAGGETYRLAGIDAPETWKPRCDAEQAAGERATARAKALLAAGEVRAFPARDPKGRRKWPLDRYGRRLARVEAGGVDVGAQLVAEGLAVPWTPGRPADWCAATRAAAGRP